MNSKPQERIILDVGTWKKTFQELIQEVKPWARWTLKFDETLQPDRVAQSWKQYQQTEFGRFRCSSCKRNWASAQVKILCHMYLEPWKSQGQVLMRLFGQRCQKCSRFQFERPEFSSDSTMRILKNLVRRIQEKYYGEGIKKYPKIPVIAEVPLEGYHDTANCEACVLGFCVWSSQNCMTKPLSYMEIGSSLPHTGDIRIQNKARNQSAGAKKAQGSGYSFKPKASGPSRATAGTQVPGRHSAQTGDRPTTQAAGRSAGCTWNKDSTHPSSRITSPRVDRPTAHMGADSKSTLERGQQTLQRIYSQTLRRTGQQSKQETGSQATSRAPGTLRHQRGQTHSSHGKQVPQLHMDLGASGKLKPPGEARTGIHTGRLFQTALPDPLP